MAMVLAVLAGLGVVQAGSAEATHVAAGTTIDVTASSGYAFAPDTFEQVTPSANISVSFTDASSIAHTFTIIGREGWVIPGDITTSAFDNLVYGKTYPALFNLNVSGAGTTLSGTFSAPAAGWYEFVCTEPGHFQEGMYGFIAFGMNLPSNLTVSSGVPGPGAALFIIIGTIVSLVVIALVLGFVVGRRHGARHEMPPERLGYAEPPAAEASLPPMSEGPPHR